MENNNFKICELLENCLNNSCEGTWKVHYDACESGITDIYCDGKILHRILNTALCMSMNITDLLNGKMDV